MDQKEEYKLKKLIRELKKIRGRHTELVSVYIPQGYDINGVLNQLSSEQGTASNIKSKSTRKNVVDGLEKVIQALRFYKQTPPYGLALFAGNVSEREGIPDIKVWAIEPPEPITIRLYRCDQTFITEPLDDFVSIKDVYGLIAIDNKEATIATLKGDRYVIAKYLTSGYHGKHRAGGQSARRFERIIRGQSHDFRVKVANYAEKEFLEIENLKGIIIGGPVATKDAFVDDEYLHHELRKKIIGVKDITYTDESGIRELINASTDLLEGVQMVHQKQLMDRFIKQLVKDGNICYGKIDVESALNMGAIEVLLLSENLEDELIDKLFDAAQALGTQVEIVSDNFEEGFQLWNTFGGVAALLRYKIS
ncbi:MAG: peptide chain release factor 1 [Candidatus Altiarchaeales archaeon HGW-Altiarchaeales-3]|nr:MAG: peptide chain release factor 1 [Candidatus Altiarchaeales archaeon HGW-Altiarchaeales-3]